MNLTFPEIKHDDYGNVICDKNKYNVKIIKDLDIGNIIVLKNNIVKIIETHVSHPKRKYSREKRFVDCVGIFDDKKYTDVIFTDHLIFSPILKYDIFEFVNMTDKIIELYDEDKNEIIEINICQQIDAKIIKCISDNNENKLKIKVVQFEQLKRIVDIIRPLSVREN